MNECRVCQNSRGNKVHTFRERYLGLGDPFDYIECGRCHSLSIVDAPENMEPYYPANYYSYVDRTYNSLLGFVKGCRDRHYLGNFSPIGALAALFLPAPVYIEWLKNMGVPAKGRVLDIGCGAGTLIVNLQDAGYKAVGIDPYIVKPITYANGARVLKQSIAETTGSYDCIMLHHCLEHMDAPREVFRHIDRLLKPDGRLLIRIPVAGTHAWKTYGEHWFQLDAPRHLILFTGSSLCALAKEFGFRVREVVNDSTANQFWASEQYLRGMVHMSPTSYAVNPDNSIFSSEEIQAFTEASHELNHKNEGDQAAFYFTRAAEHE